MSQFPSRLPTTLTLPYYPLPTSIHQHITLPTTPPSSLSPTLPSLFLVRTVPTISLTNIPLAVSLPPDIDPGSAEWQCIGQPYSGYIGRMYPHTPSPLPSYTCPAADIYICPPHPSLDAFSPAVGIPCGGNRPGSSRSEGTSPRTRLQTVGYPINSLI